MPVYTSNTDKARKYVEQTIPEIFWAATSAARKKSESRHFAKVHHVLVMWLGHIGLGEVLRGLVPVADLHLAQLHEAVRGRKYLAEDESEGAQDCVQDVGQTLVYGGDCEDYAAVLLAACWALGVRSAVLVTAGSRQDHFEHVRVEVLLGRWFVLDPKGDQQGAPFDVADGEFEVIRRWVLERGGIRELA